jgi:hypothetical protein
LLLLLAAIAAVAPIACSSDPSGPSNEAIVHVAGQFYAGRHGYVEYQAGNLPIVLGAPHGGGLTPSEIPDRTWGTTGRDSRTQELARSFATAIHELTGRYAHIVINRLHRSKLDANREIGEAAQGNLLAQDAWADWHMFIEAAKDTILAQYGHGLYIDLHGHGHDIQRLELGYLLSRSELELTDQEMIDQDLASESSIRALSQSTSASFPALLRGTNSLGTLLQSRGYASVPSQWIQDPGGAPYFTGGYNTRRHGSSDGGLISSIQIECNWQGVRDSEANREAFAAALVSALDIYFETHLGITLGGP